MASIVQAEFFQRFRFEERRQQLVELPDRESFEAIPDELVHTTSLVGTEAEVAERVGRFAAAGVDRLIVSPAHLERDQQLHTLERLAAMAGVNSPE